MIFALRLFPAQLIFPTLFKFRTRNADNRARNVFSPCSVSPFLPLSMKKHTVMILYGPFHIGVSSGRKHTAMYLSAPSSNKTIRHPDIVRQRKLCRLRRNLSLRFSTARIISRAFRTIIADGKLKLPRRQLPAAPDIHLG